MIEHPSVLRYFARLEVPTLEPTSRRRHFSREARQRRFAREFAWLQFRHARWAGRRVFRWLMTIAREDKRSPVEAKTLTTRIQDALELLRLNAETQRRFKLYGVAPELNKIARDHALTLFNNWRSAGSPMPKHRGRGW